MIYIGDVFRYVLCINDVFGYSIYVCIRTYLKTSLMADFGRNTGLAGVCVCVCAVAKICIHSYKYAYTYIHIYIYVYMHMYTGIAAGQ